MSELKKEAVISEKTKQQELLEVFQKHFPSCLQELADGSFAVDKEKLQRALEPKNWGRLDDNAQPREIKQIIEEGLELRWVGKKEAYHSAYTSCRKILKPLESDSKNFKSTKNLLIKADNLEALKLLKNNYFEKIKLIYIDPPYNTGSDGFIYNDNFSESQSQVLEELGYNDEQKDYVKNIAGAKTHSGWLSFMYPRLLLARDLLRDDGVIFISIDDNEQANLKLLCDEVFGSNGVEQMVWRKSGIGRDGKMKNTTTFRNDHEYILVVYKNHKQLNKSIEKPNWVNSYGNPDNDPRGSYKSGSISKREEASNKNSKYYYTVQSPSGKAITRQFEISETEFNKLNDDKRIYWGKNQDAVPSVKIFENEKRTVSTSSLIDNKEATTTQGSKELDNILKLSGVGNEIRPKPSALINKLIQIGSNKESLILDFFAGSGTTADAVMQLNAEDEGNRKFILVQLAEKIAENSESYNFVKDELKKEPTIFEICAERIRRAGTQLEKDSSLDTGFKVFELCDDENNEIYNKDVATLQKDEVTTLTDNSFKLADKTLLYNLILGEGLALTEKIDCLIKNCLFKVANRLFVLREFDLNKYSDLLKDKAIDYVCVYYKNFGDDNNFIRNLENCFDEGKIKVKG